MFYFKQKDFELIQDIDDDDDEVLVCGEDLEAEPIKHEEVSLLNPSNISLNYHCSRTFGERYLIVWCIWRIVVRFCRLCFSKHLLQQLSYEKPERVQML